MSHLLKRVGIFAIAGLTLGLGTAQSGEAARLTATVNGIQQQFVALVKKKDAKGAEKLIRSVFAKSFTNTDLNGRVTTLEDFIVGQKANIASLKSVVSIKVNLSNVKVKGTTATGVGTFLLDAVVLNHQDKTKTHKLKVNSKWHSTFKKVNGKWWIVADKTISEKVLIDGKPVG